MNVVKIKNAPTRCLKRKAFVANNVAVIFVRPPGVENALSERSINFSASLTVNCTHFGVSIYAVSSRWNEPIHQQKNGSSSWQYDWIAHSSMVGQSECLLHLCPVSKRQNLTALMALVTCCALPLYVWQYKVYSELWNYKTVRTLTEKTNCS